MIKIERLLGGLLGSVKRSGLVGFFTRSVCYFLYALDAAYRACDTQILEILMIQAQLTRL